MPLICVLYGLTGACSDIRTGLQTRPASGTCIPVSWNSPALRGGDRRTFYVHPPDARKRDVAEWFAVLNRIERGVMPSVQKSNVDWTGGLAEWLER